MSAQALEVSLSGVGTPLRLERDTWSMVKWLWQANNEYAPLLAMSSWSVKSRRTPSRHCRDARVYVHTTTAMHDMSTHSTRKSRANDGRVVNEG